jgi:hypothetical protein
MKKKPRTTRGNANNEVIMTSEITIGQEIRFLMPDATRQRGEVVGFVQRDDITKIAIAVTTGADQGRTVYVTEDWVIGSVEAVAL